RPVSRLKTVDLPTLGWPERATRKATRPSRTPAPLVRATEAWRLSSIPLTWQALHDDLARLASAQGHARVAQVHDQGAAPNILHDPQRNTRSKTQGGQAAQKIVSALDALHTDRFSLSDCAQANRR